MTGGNGELTERKSTRLETEGLEEIPTGVQSHPLTAICTKCKIKKSLNFFGKSKKWHPWCLECKSSKTREHYSNNRSYYALRDKKSRIKKRKENRKYITEYLKEHPCIDCGEPDIIVLQFDHVRGKKKYNISQMLDKVTLRKVKEEIEKCEIRCANCHLRRTAYSRNWYSNWEDLKDSYIKKD